jgi:chaperonin GroEL (HSP60 family)
VNQWWGIGAVFVIGLVIIVYGWLSDRMAIRRREAALREAPDRVIPGLEAKLPTPDYVLAEELQAAEQALENPRVLVVDGELNSIRELLPALTADGPLLVVAAGFGREVATELAANAAAGTRQLATIVADAAGRAEICAETGATEVPIADLRAGYLPATALGSYDRWEPQTLK